MRSMILGAALGFAVLSGLQPVSAVTPHPDPPPQGGREIRPGGGKLTATTEVRADPLVGPHVLDEARHLFDVMHVTPAHGQAGPLRSRLSAEGPAVVQPAALVSNGGALRREVLGFATYWDLSGNQQVNWNYSLLSTVAYFGLDINADGTINTNNSGWTMWNSQQLVGVVSAAHQAGDRVVVVIKPVSPSESTICSIVNTPTFTQQTINSVIAAIGDPRWVGGLDGVNVDFEGNSSPGCTNGSIQTGFTNFMRQLTSRVHQRFPGSFVSVDTYGGSASWDGGIFKIGDLGQIVDAMFIMAYDSALSNTPGQAGPEAPMNGWTYNDTLDVNQYLSKAPPYKILLGVPYYGHKWTTTDATPPPGGSPPSAYAPAKSGTGADAISYAGIQDDFACALNVSKNWDSTADEPWATWWSPPSGDPCGGNHGAWRELYYEDAQALGFKYDLINADGLLGTGMWTLGYQGSSPDLWNEIAAKLTGPASTYYFAEGFTGPGFSETLSLLMPGFSGVATIDYFTDSGHFPSQSVYLSAGHVTNVNVNAYVGPYQQVAARVTLPAPGVAERSLHFQFAKWHGSTDVVGVTQPAAQWNFAEGSTLSAFTEYLTLQNPGATAAAVILNYFTDEGAHPVKALTVAADSRVTVQVFSGDLSSPSAPCTPSGPGANCGVGAGIPGVSVQVQSTVPIVAERPMYVNGFSFGSGNINDGHDDFGATAAATQWSFAEGTTLDGFNEYLSLQNPGATTATVSMKFMDTSGAVTTRTRTVAAQSRSTVVVNDPTQGVGPGVGGVAVQVTSDQPIVAERPMYIVHNFGSGLVAGADVVLGSTKASVLSEFSALSTGGGDYDYLTIQNPGSQTASLTVSYLTASTRVTRTFTVAPSSRHTVAVFAAGEGLGPGSNPFGVVVVSDQPIFVEKPTYSSNPSTYGATDTMGASPGN